MLASLHYHYFLCLLTYTRATKLHGLIPKISLLFLLFIFFYCGQVHVFLSI